MAGFQLSTEAKGFEPRSHAGAGSLLNLHFVKPEFLDAGDGRLFARLQKYRLEADYSVEFVLTQDAIEEDLAACRAFLMRIRDLVRTLLP